MIDNLRILREMARQDFNAEDEINVNEAVEDMISEYNDIEVYNQDAPVYTEAMVPVHVISEDKYLVEAEDLLRYMYHNNIGDPSRAIIGLKEHNGLNLTDKMIVLVESNEYIEEVIEEAKKSKKDTKAKATAKFLKDLKTKGIKVMKKKK